MYACLTYANISIRYVRHKVQNLRIPAYSRWTCIHAIHFLFSGIAYYQVLNTILRYKIRETRHLWRRRRRRQGLWLMCHFDGAFRLPITSSLNLHDCVYLMCLYVSECRVRSTVRLHIGWNFNSTCSWHLCCWMLHWHIVRLDKPGLTATLSTQLHIHTQTGTHRDTPTIAESMFNSFRKCRHNVAFRFDADDWLMGLRDYTCELVR